MDPTATVSSRGAARVRAGHPWVFRQDVLDGPDADAASGGPALVVVVDGRGRQLAVATWAAHAKLALRVLSFGADPLPGNLLGVISARLDAALARRGGMGLDRDAFRVAHAESDGLPGLFVDAYADAAVIQTASVAMDAALHGIAALVRDKLRARVVVARNDGGMREFEGLPRVAEVVLGEDDRTQVVYRLGANHFEADLLTDGKTGGFLDQADNHATVAALASRGARCLDAFTHHGGFALALARRGGAVLAGDADPQAISRAAANAARNELRNVETRVANAFDLLRELEAAKEEFDAVVLDPPALAKRASALPAADRGYRELILRGLRLTARGGLLVACSCSGRVSRGHFDDLVAAAAAGSGRRAQVIARHGAGRDHPELVGIPETGHLKCWILRVL